MISYFYYTLTCYFYVKIKWNKEIISSNLVYQFLTRVSVSFKKSLHFLVLLNMVLFSCGCPVASHTVVNAKDVLHMYSLGSHFNSP